MPEKSLIQLILDLLRDPELLAEFKDDPQGLLASCGLSGVSTEDVHDAIVLAQDNDDVSFDRDYNTGSQVGGAHVPPPPPISHPGPGKDHHEDHHEAAVKYLDNYVTNNHYTYNVDDRDTIVDNSINQNIDTDGGDFRQDIDTNSVVASGDGAVAAGRDISDSTITTGNDNLVGDGNQVVDGDDNTTAFGTGDALSTGDIALDEGSAFSIGGNATGNDSVNDSYNETENTTTNETTNTTEDSNNQEYDYSQETVTQDSGNTDLLSDNEVDVNVEAAL
ncbi:IniB N-terminal domain-containing protein [Pseudonocardia nantongensis]|uniref:IniB N-terminal domain-containing protein n=1 Tax=Pseudonocardia nantongensis TaxID=1181885 RepID=UPI00397DDD7C